MGTLSDIRTPQDAYSIGVFDGKERFLRFDLNAFAELERLYGDMGNLDQVLTSGRMTDIRRIIWAGLIWDDAVLDEVTGEPIRYNVSIHQVGSWITMQNMKNLMVSVTDALKGSMPDDPDLQKAINDAQRVQAEIANIDDWKPPSDRIEELKEGESPNEDSGTGDSTTIVD